MQEAADVQESSTCSSKREAAVAADQRKVGRATVALAWRGMLAPFVGASGRTDEIVADGCAVVARRD